MKFGNPTLTYSFSFYHKEYAQSQTFTNIPTKLVPKQTTLNSYETVHIQHIRNWYQRKILKNPGSTSHTNIPGKCILSSLHQNAGPSIITTSALNHDFVPCSEYLCIYYAFFACCSRNDSVVLSTWFNLITARFWRNVVWKCHWTPVTGDIFHNL
jgi:hypothetical protein